MAENDQSDFLSANNLARLFGVTERSIVNWVGEGLPAVRVKGKVNRYPWRPCLEWWLANKYTGPSKHKKNGPPSKVESEALLFQVRAEREQLDLDIFKRQIIPVDQIEPAWLRAAEIVKSRVMGLAPKIKSAIPTLKTEDVTTIRELCREALDEIAKCPQQPIS